MAYEQVGFSGEQYVLEKGVYRNCDDWGLGNSALASLQPVLQVCADSPGQGAGPTEEPAHRGRGPTGRGFASGRCGALGTAQGRGIWEGAGSVPGKYAGRVLYCQVGGIEAKRNEQGLGLAASLSLETAPSLQVGEHDLHFVSKVRRRFPHFKALTPFASLPVPLL